MAETVSIGAGNPAKVRNPWAVAGLIFATVWLGAVIATAILFSLDGETGLIVAVTVAGFVPIFALGIYGVFWLFFVLRELRDFGVARSDERLSRIRPGLNVGVMVLTGGLVIPAIVILGLLARRILHAQELAGAERSSTPLLVALLIGGLFLYLPLFVLYGVLQDGLNRVWRSLPATAAAGVPVA